MGFRERPVTAREFIKLLKNLGFELERQRSGAHEQWMHPRFEGKRRAVTVSQHNAPFHGKILKFMRNQAGLSKRELWKCLEDEKYARQLGANNAPVSVLGTNR